jgi:8-oxo-dGTP pyrophosphatase MutT (NUDIX family)
LGFGIFDLGGLTIDYSSLKQLIDDGFVPGPPADYACRPACVFLLLYNRDEPYFLAIQKSDTDGYPWCNQVALPGGHIEKYDASPIDAAYREVQEEVNIPRGQIEFIGSIGHYQTINDRDIQVFVGLWNGQGPVRYESAEISRILEIPVREILQTHIANHYHDRIPDVSELTYPFQDVVIWGVTARILHHFIELIFPLMNNP